MIKLRSYRALDEDFIYHSWLASLDRSIRGVNHAVRPIIDEAISEGRISVACSDEDEDHILGWLAWGVLDDRPILLYLFVKKSLRNNGIGIRLLRSVFPPDLQILTAFWSFWVQRYELKQKWDLKYNALLLPVMLHGVSHGKAESE